MKWRAWQPRTAMRLILGGVLAAAVLYGALSLQAQYHEAIRDTYVTGETVALLVEEHVSRSIDAADQLVLRVRERLAPTGVRSYDDADRQWLLSLEKETPGIDAVGIADRDGRMVLHTRSVTGVLSIADRGYFRHHLETGASFFIGQAVPARSHPEKSVFTVSRSIIGPDGSFQGIVVVGIDVAYFNAIYRRLRLGDNAAVAILRQDGALLLREPFVPKLIEPGMAERIRGWRVFTDFLDHGISAGTYEGPTTSDDLTRTYAFRQVSGFPLVVVVMLAHSDAVMALLPGILRGVGLTGALLLTLLLLSWWSLRIFDREAQARNALAEALEAAEAANQAKAAFLSNMSHELRTPLNAVIGFAEAVHQGYAGPTTERQREYLADMRDAGQHLLDILTDMLDFSRLASGNMSLDETFIDLGSVAESAVERFRGPAAGKGIALIVERPAELPELRGDAQRCRQILLHLLSNAVKFTPPGGCIQVSVLQVPSGGLAIQVRDNGRGMNATDIPGAMEAFSLLASSPTKTQDGAGIGLPLAKRLTELHGGSLVMASSPGNGTVVTVTFPAERVREIAIDPGTQALATHGQA